MHSSPNACMEASDLPLGEGQRPVAAGGTQEVQSEMEGAVERHMGRGPEAEATTPLTIVLARLSNGQMLLRIREHLGWMMLETVAWGSVNGSEKMRRRYWCLSRPPLGATWSRWWFGK